MTGSLGLLALLVLVMAVGLHILSQLSLAKNRTIYDIPDLLRCVDEESDRDLFDSSKEMSLKSRKVPVNFRRTQLMGLHRANESFKRKYHNVSMFWHLARTELAGIRQLGSEDEYSQEVCQAMELICKHGREFRWLTLLVICKVHFLRTVLLLDKVAVFPIPSVARLRSVFAVDLLHLYAQIKVSAVALADVYGKGEVVRSRM